MFHFSFRVALSMKSLMFVSSVSDFLIFLSLKVLSLSTCPALNHIHPEHSRPSQYLLSSVPGSKSLLYVPWYGWRVYERLRIKACWDSRLQSYLYLWLQEVTGENYPQSSKWILSHKVPSAHPKREQRSKQYIHKADGQETRNWKWGHIEWISQKIHGKSLPNWLLEFFPKLKTILFWWNQWIIAHEHLNSNLKEGYGKK